MADNVEGALKNEWYREDLRALTSQLREHESLLRLKRRWLMDLPLTTREQKRVDEMRPDDKVLPESLIREDDVSYEDIKTCIEMGFGAHKCENERHCAQEDVQVLYNSRECFQDICFLLDDMTNTGLCSLTKRLTGGTIKFDKTNWSMKRIIKELLPKVIAEKNDISKTILKQVFQLLKDPNNFHGNHVLCSTVSEAYRAAAINVLDGLEDLPMKAILAMHRKLRGVTNYIPSLNPPKSGRGRDQLISLVKKMCTKMLLDLGELDEPSEELAGAFGVASLTLKLIMNRPDVRDFRRFSPEIESLQNDIAKAIHLLNHPKKVSLIELKKVQLLLDPNFRLSVRSLRTAVRNLLTEYLYECSDMDKVPQCLVETVNIINRRPSRKKRSSYEILLSPQELMKEVIQKEVEHVLIVSAQAKEIVSDLLPQHGFDKDFAHAYMEDFEGSNNSLCISDDEQVGDFYERCEEHSCDSYGQIESFGETNLVKSNSPSPISPLCSSNWTLRVPVESMHISKMDSDETSGFVSQITPNCVFSDSPLEETNIVSEQSRSGNQYLAVQEACDVTAMVAYRFVGHMLDKLAKIEGLELYPGDRLYLLSHSSDPEDSEGLCLEMERKGNIILGAR